MFFRIVFSLELDRGLGADDAIGQQTTILLKGADNEFQVPVEQRLVCNRRGVLDSDGAS